ncbi:mitotic checkpoint protein BUB3 [Lepeophtheirus salmonis]|uniref:Mitotic checkpoint protein BUB3 n=1 Tax=Lepeophtheirus salmonis TaxID=72036 RepID=D3PGJ5_LEPSM|nr:mitotic checkpoint protein BUB3-like [Lepeophtheirus salmonis]ADD24391.1 Mitotic checkpoint protein BUB3 [Lepeophtheirus salmonis]
MSIHTNNGDGGVSRSGGGEYKIKNAPDDGITKAEFGPNSAQFLLVSSWDKSVRLYDVINDTLRVKYSHSAPVLDCTFQDPIRVWSGGLDGSLKTFDINSGTETLIGSHEKAVKCVRYSEEINGLISGSWDSTIKFWDPRNSNPLIGTYPQPERVYALSLAGEKLVIATLGRKVWVWDIRNMSYVQQKRESSLKYQTRALGCFPNKSGYVLSSIEGRVAVEYLDPSTDIQKKKYAFKCHRSKENGIEVIYPVNTIAFHKEYNTFATGGSDGLVNIWDGHNKKRLCQFHKYPTSIASLTFSNDGRVLAIASSYMYEEGKPLDTPIEDSIYIRHVSDQETKPK